MKASVMLGEEEDDRIVQTLCTIRCFGYRVPPRKSSETQRCAGWKDKQVWAGSVLVQCDGVAAVALFVEPDGRLFASSPLSRSDAVEECSDSSRYFVMRVENGDGKAAYIGIGFEKRQEAFDFTAAVQDSRKLVSRSGQGLQISSSFDMTLGHDEQLTLNIGSTNVGAACLRLVLPSSC